MNGAISRREFIVTGALDESKLSVLRIEALKS
jgi:hypothetical protein